VVMVVAIQVAMLVVVTGGGDDGGGGRLGERGGEAVLRTRELS
jgi:hypothetical protein